MVTLWSRYGHTMVTPRCVIHLGRMCVFTVLYSMFARWSHLGWSHHGHTMVTPWSRLGRVVPWLCACCVLAMCFIQCLAKLLAAKQWQPSNGSHSVAAIWQPSNGSQCRAQCHGHHSVMRVQVSLVRNTNFVCVCVCSLEACMLHACEHNDKAHV